MVDVLTGWRADVRTGSTSGTEIGAQSRAVWKASAGGASLGGHKRGLKRTAKELHWTWEAPLMTLWGGHLHTQRDPSWVVDTNLRLTCWAQHGSRFADRRAVSCIQAGSCFFGVRKCILWLWCPLVCRCRADWTENEVLWGIWFCMVRSIFMNDPFSWMRMHMKGLCLISSCDSACSSA